MTRKNSNLDAFLFCLLVLIVQPVLARDLLNVEKTIIEKTVKGELLDPESARFKWVPLPSIGVDAYCGLVNSKNRFGGYAGDAPYIVFVIWKNQTIVLAAPLRIGSNDPDSPASIGALTMCKKHGYTNLLMAV